MTHETAPPPLVPRFGIGVLLSTAFGIIGRNIVPLVLLLLVLGGIQYAVVNWLYQGAMTALGVYGVATVLMLSGSAVDSLTNGFVTVVALTALEQGRADWRRAAARMPKVFVPLALPSLAVELVNKFGGSVLPLLAKLVLVVLIALCTWVYAAVLVREGGNPLGAVRRNLELTRGRRWFILGWLASVVIFAIVAGFATNLLTRSLLIDMGMNGAWRASVIMQLALSLAMNAFCYTVAAVGYRILRHERDGPEENRVAEVFD
jgi:hypothetical protein